MVVYLCLWGHLKHSSFLFPRYFHIIFLKLHLPRWLQSLSGLHNEEISIYETHQFLWLSKQRINSKHGLVIYQQSIVSTVSTYFQLVSRYKYWFVLLLTSNNAFNIKYIKFETTICTIKEKADNRNRENIFKHDVLYLQTQKFFRTTYLPSNFCNSSWDILHHRWQGKTIAVSQRSPALPQVSWSLSGSWLDSQSHIRCKLITKII